MPVLPPCGTSGTRCSAASRTISATSSVEAGASIAGEAPCTRPRQSVSHGSISAGIGDHRLSGRASAAACGDQLRLARSIAAWRAWHDGATRVKAARMDTAAHHPRRRPRPERRDRPRRQAAVAPPGRPQAVQGADHGQRDGDGPQDVRQPARPASGPPPHRADARSRLERSRAPRSRTMSTRRCGWRAASRSRSSAARRSSRCSCRSPTGSSSPKCSRTSRATRVDARPARERRLARDVQRRASGGGRPPALPLRDAGARLVLRPSVGCRRIVCSPSTPSTAGAILSRRH